MTETPAAPRPLARGVYGVLATPFAGPDLAVDTGSLRAQVRLLRSAGAVGLVALGVFGEAASLDPDEQRLVVETVAGEAPGLPLVIGLSGRATAPVVAQATRLLATGVTPAGLMVQVHSTDPDVLLRHLDAVHAATGAGVVVQDYPALSGVTVPPAAIAGVVARAPYVVAVKAEAPPTAAAVAALTAATAVPVFGGLGGVGLLDELAAGAAGAMTGFSFPEGLVRAVTAHAAGGFDAARAAWAPWLPLSTFETQPGIGLAVRKRLLHHRGVLADPAVRPPARPFPAVLDNLARAHLAAAAPLLEEEPRWTSG